MEEEKPKTFRSTDSKAIQATLLGIEGSTVRIRMENGDVAEVPPARFSLKDLQYFQA